MYTCAEIAGRGAAIAMRVLAALSLTALLGSAAAAAAALCTIRPHVGRHVVRSALDVSTQPLFGWQVSPACAGAQTAYTITVAAAGMPLVRLPRVASNISDAVRYAGAALLPGKEYRVHVAAEFGGGGKAAGHADFVTALSAAQLGSAPPVWNGNQSAEYVLFRREVQVKHAHKDSLSPAPVVVSCSCCAAMIPQVIPACSC